MKSMTRFIATVAVTATIATVIVVKLFGSPSAQAEPMGAPANVTLEPIQIAQADTGSAGSAAAPATGSAAAPATGSDAGSAAGTPAPAAGAGSGSAAAAPQPVELAWYDKLVQRPVEESGNFWMPKAVNDVADDSDFMFITVLGLSTFFFIAIAVAVIYLTIKYRHRPGHKAEPSSAHNDALEVTWTVIPTIICVFLFLSLIHI